MSARVLALAGLLLCMLAAPASAQTAADDKVDDMAMARARRQATSPMRWILQAGRLQRKVSDAPAGAGSAPGRSVAGPAQPDPISRSTAPAADFAVDVPAIRETVQPIYAAPALEPEPEPKMVEPPAALPAMPGPATVAAEARAARASAAPAPEPLPLAVGLTLLTPKTRLPPPEPVAVPVAVVEPKLLSMVEPALPPDVQAELRRSGELMAELSLNVDGTVGDVRLLSRTPRNVQRVLLAALSQWRFEPMVQPTVHRVQLVFEH
jgi:hypothetical protein